MRIQFTLKQATVEGLTGRADALDIPVSRLLEHIVSEWLLTGGAVVLRPAAPSKPKIPTHTHGSSATAAYPQPSYGVGSQDAVTDDEEDTQQCKDCAEVVPMSGYTPGMEHMGCKQPGANIVALRREACGLPPL
jgi:hypothetical protein